MTDKAETTADSTLADTLLWIQSCDVQEQEKTPKMSVGTLADRLGKL